MVRRVAAACVVLAIGLAAPLHADEGWRYGLTGGVATRYHYLPNQGSVFADGGFLSGTASGSFGETWTASVFATRNLRKRIALRVELEVDAP